MNYQDHAMKLNSNGFPPYAVIASPNRGDPRIPASFINDPNVLWTPDDFHTGRMMGLDTTPKAEATGPSHPTSFTNARLPTNDFSSTRTSIYEEVHKAALAGKQKLDEMANDKYNVKKAVPFPPQRVDAHPEYQDIPIQQPLGPLTSITPRPSTTLTSRFFPPGQELIIPARPRRTGLLDSYKRGQPRRGQDHYDPRHEPAPWRPNLADSITYDYRPAPSVKTLVSSNSPLYDGLEYPESISPTSTLTNEQALYGIPPPCAIQPSCAIPPSCAIQPSCALPPSSAVSPPQAPFRVGFGYIPMENVTMNQAPLSIPGSPNNEDIWQRRRIEQEKEMMGISRNYRGDHLNEENQSADIPETENTSLWMTNLPPNCTHKMLLSAIRNCGKVYACVVNPPTGNHVTAAAKVVFFDRAGADNLLFQVSQGHFKVGGFVPRMRGNRIRTASRLPGPHNRVLHIEGPPQLINGEFLSYFFHTKFTFDLEDVLDIQTHNPARVRQEWRFGSYRCQAEAARQAIHREKGRTDLPPFFKELWDQVNVHFGVDPCEP